MQACIILFEILITSCYKNESLKVIFEKMIFIIWLETSLFFKIWDFFLKKKKEIEVIKNILLSSGMIFIITKSKKSVFIRFFFYLIKHFYWKKLTLYLFHQHTYFTHKSFQYFIQLFFLYWFLIYISIILLLSKIYIRKKSIFLVFHITLDYYISYICLVSSTIRLCLFQNYIFHKNIFL